MLKKGIIFCGLLVSLALAAPVWSADVLKGMIFSDKEPYMEVFINSDSQIRIDYVEDEEENVYMLVIDGQRWLVGRDDDKSAWEAVDFNVLVTAMLEIEGRSPDVSSQATIAKAGAQTVNGITGEAFKVKFPGGEDFTIVLSENRDAVAITQALALFMKDIEDGEEGQLLYNLIERLNAENNKVYGFLKFEDEYELKSIERINVPDSYFTMPAGVKVLDIKELFEELD